MGNFDLPTFEYRGASMCYLTTLIPEKRQRCDSPEDTQLVSVGLILRTLESQWPPHPSVCCKPESSFECNCIQWYFDVYCLTFPVTCGVHFSSVQFSRSAMSDSLWPHGLQHARPSCPSPALRVYANSCLRVGDAIQPSHPLSSPSPAFSVSQHQGLFNRVSSSHQVAKVLEFQLQHQYFQ